MGLSPEEKFMEGLNDFGGGRPGQVKKMRIPQQYISAEDIDGALRWIEQAGETIAEGIKTLARITGGLIREGAFRSVVVTLENRTPFALYLQDSGTKHGIWTKDRSPPDFIPPYSVATWSSESEGFVTGTEAWVQYSVRGDESLPSYGHMLGGTGFRFQMNWDNPAGGSNSVSKHWFDDGKGHNFWDRVHLREPDYIKDNQAHHHWKFDFDGDRTIDDGH